MSMSYAIVKTGGKQYRVEQGQSLLVERLPVDDGAKVRLEPLLYVDGSEVVDSDGLSQVTVQARVVAHERGPKLRIVKFKPKRGYKRRTGHRQELTRLEVTEIKLASRRGKRTAAASEGSGKAVASEGSGKAVASEGSGKAVASEGSGKAVASEGSGKAASKAPTNPISEGENGS